MDASDLYKCLADPQRLRILSLLEDGPLCVCHLQELLAESQVKMSKQLAYLKQNGLVDARREGTWMIYALRDDAAALLRVNLAHLREADCPECDRLRQDLVERARLVLRITEGSAPCPESVCERIGCG